MHRPRIDLNADLGEEVTDDRGLLRIVTSANVACGYHAGNRSTMRAVCGEAARLGVRIGAHVSYADRAGFGRVEQEVDPETLRDQVADQLGALEECAAAAGALVAYVKPHGALYHRVLRDPVQATAVLDATASLPVLTMGVSVLGDLARERGRVSFVEGFPDRAYAADGSLLPRHQPGAVLTDSAAIAAHAVALAARVDSVCVHGDSPGAVAHADAVRRALEAAGYELGRG